MGESEARKSYWPLLLLVSAAKIRLRLGVRGVGNSNAEGGLLCCTGRQIDNRCRSMDEFAVISAKAMLFDDGFCRISNGKVVQALRISAAGGGL